MVFSNNVFTIGFFLSVAIGIIIVLLMRNQTGSLPPKNTTQQTFKNTAQITTSLIFLLCVLSPTILEEGIKTGNLKVFLGFSSVFLAVEGVYAIKTMFEEIAKEKTE